ncbi:MAG: (2Fe-2S)-binding protein [Candidatus Omnitrophica bacterium]|nr:(2Fe-2S)-binding protein [Candidatus Omnitrophota bacterium]
MPTLTIDGKKITVADGTTVLQACEKLKIDVPRYCYHPGLSIAGNCRICMVEIEKAPKPAISCQTLSTEGMVVRTDTEQVKQVRSHILEFLLVNHPLDCPVCDQAGECYLQDYYMKFGLYDPKFNENKVKKQKKAFPIGPTIMLDQERCILCSRCVRFTDEITKSHEFGIVNRGDHSEVVVSKEFVNPYSGNVADICPVGALTDRDFRFKCRVWYLENSPSVCPGCSRGCSIEIHHNDRKSHRVEPKRVMRLKPRFNEEINKWWICDEGRYNYKFIDDNRILLVKGAEDWPSAVKTLASKLKNLAALSPQSAAFLLSPQQSNEELFLAEQIFAQLFDRSRLFLVRPNALGYQDAFLIKADKNPNTAGARALGFSYAENIVDLLSGEAEKGKLKALYIFGQDIVSLFGDDARKLLKQLEFVVYQGSNRNETAPLCSMTLPAAVYAEQEGTFTNCDGILQRFTPAFAPLPEAREGIQILHDLAVKLGIKCPGPKAREIFARMAEKAHAFKGMNFDRLGRMAQEKAALC